MNCTVVSFSTVFYHVLYTYIWLVSLTLTSWSGWCVQLYIVHVCYSSSTACVMLHCLSMCFSPFCLDIGAPPRYEHLFPMHQIRCEMHQAKTEGGQSAVTLPLRLCGLLCNSSMLSTLVHVHVVVHGALHVISVQFCLHTRLQHSLDSRPSVRFYTQGQRSLYKT